MKTIIYMLTFLMLLSITFASGGGFGEYAGPLTFNTLNGMNTQTWTLVNTYNHSIQFTIIKPTIEGINITTSPANGGTIPANSAFPIQITVSGLTTSTSNPTIAYITAQVVNNESSNSSNIHLAIAKKMTMYLEQTTITTSSVTVSTSTSTVVAQAQQQSGNSNQSAVGSTTIQSTQNENSSIQGAGGGLAALAVAVRIPYLIVAIVLLLVVICALAYHITRNKSGTRKPRKKRNH